MEMGTETIFLEREGMGMSLFSQNSRLRGRRIASSKATLKLVLQITGQLASNLESKQTEVAV